MARNRCHLLFALAVSALGCTDMFTDTRPPPAPDQPMQADLNPKELEPFSCHGKPPPPPSAAALPTGTASAPGRVEIRCESDQPAPAPVATPPVAALAPGATPAAAPAPAPVIIKHEAAASKGDPLQRKCRFVAQDAPLSAVAVALSDATGLGVVVDPALAEYRVSIALPNAPLGQFLETVRNERYHVRWSMQGNEVHFALRDETPRREREQLKTRVVPVTTRVPPRQFAEAVCTLLTPRGHLAVVGHRLFVTDVPEVLSKADLLARGLEDDDVGMTPAQWNTLYDNFAQSSRSYDAAVKARRLVEDALETNDERVRRDMLQQADEMLSKLQQPDTRPAAAQPAQVPPQTLPAQALAPPPPPAQPPANQPPATAEVPEMDLQ